MVKTMSMRTMNSSGASRIGTPNVLVIAGMACVFILLWRDGRCLGAANLDAATSITSLLPAGQNGAMSTIDSVQAKLSILRQRKGGHIVNPQDEPEDTLHRKRIDIVGR